MRKKIITIHQADFIPWLGFFERLYLSDIYIILDDVQFIRRGWQHRDFIKTKNGKEWLTIPIQKKNNYTSLLKDIRIDYSTDWIMKHLKTLTFNYKNSKNFDIIYNVVKNIYEKKFIYLIELNIALIKAIIELLNIDIKIYLSSEFDLQSKSSERLIELIKKVNGTRYLTGIGSESYLDKNLFSIQKIDIEVKKFEPFFYNQLHGDFIPNLSIIDFLFNEEFTTIFKKDKQ